MRAQVIMAVSVYFKKSAKLKPKFRSFKIEGNEIKLIKLLPWCFHLCFCVCFGDLRLAQAMLSK